MIISIDLPYKLAVTLRRTETLVTKRLRKLGAALQALSLGGLFYFRSEYRLMGEACTHHGKRKDNFGRGFPSFSKHFSSHGLTKVSVVDGAVKQQEKKMIEKPNLSCLDLSEATPKVKKTKKIDNGKILYVPSDSGITQKQIDKEIHYFGLISTIPIQSYPFNIYAHDINIADLFTVLKNNSKDLIPLKNGIIERYEIQDINTCDVHVMYRVPYVYLR